MCETARWGENIGNGEFLSRPLREISTNQGHPRGVVLPALGALRGLGQARTEPARVPEGFPPLAGIVRGHCALTPGVAAARQSRAAIGRVYVCGVG
jgi:hypothetical protein